MQAAKSGIKLRLAILEIHVKKMIYQKYKLLSVIHYEQKNRRKFC